MAERPAGGRIASPLPVQEKNAMAATAPAQVQTAGAPPNSELGRDRGGPLCMSCPIEREELS